jgi:WD40 repeat protein
MKSILKFALLSLLAGKVLHFFLPNIQAALSSSERVVIQEVPVSPVVLTEPQGKLLLVIDWSVGIQFWDTQTESLLGQIPSKRGEELLAPVLAPDGCQLIWASRHEDDRDLFNFHAVRLDDIAQWPPRIRKVGSCRSSETVSKLSFPASGGSMKVETWGPKLTFNMDWREYPWSSSGKLEATDEIGLQRHPKMRLFSVSKGSKKVFDLPISQNLPDYNTSHDPMPEVALSSDSTFVAVCWPLGDHDAEFEIWDIPSAKRLTSERVRGFVNNIAHCPRSNRFFLGAGASKYDPSTGGVFVVDNPRFPRLRKFPRDVYVEEVSEARFDESGGKFFTKSVHGTITFWDLESLTLSHQHEISEGDGGSGLHVRASKDGSLWFDFCDIYSDKPNPDINRFNQFVFDSDGRCIGGGRLTPRRRIEGFYFHKMPGEALGLDTRDYRPLCSNSLLNDVRTAAQQAGFHPHPLEADYVVYKREDTSAFASSQGLKWLAWHDKKAATIRFHAWGGMKPPASIRDTSDISCLDIHPSLPLLLVSTRSRSTRLINLSTRQSVLLVAQTSPDPEWIIYSDDGFFEASKRGALLVSLVKGSQAWQIDQFVHERNRPDILLDRLGMLTTAKKQVFDVVRSQREIKAQKYDNFAIKEVPMPDMRLENVSPDRREANINISHPSAVQVELRVNGTFVQRVFLPQGNVQMKATMPLVAGFNRIEAEALTSEATRGARSHVTVWGGQNVSDRTFIVSMGVSDYLDESLQDLVYAAKDARDLSAAFERASVSSKTESLVLTDANMTKAALKKVRTFLASAQPADTIVIFMAGHGLRQNDDYYYLTHDTNMASIQNTSVSFSDLERVLKECRSLKKLVLLDTCYSGENSVDFVQGDNTHIPAPIAVETTSLNHSTEMRIREAASKMFLNRRLLSGDLLRRSGAIVFSACLAHEVSGEDDAIQQGIFTHALLQALKTVATDTDENRRISVRELARSVSSIVIDYTKGQQHPTVDRDNHLQNIEFLVTEEVPDRKTINSILLNLRALVDNISLTDNDTRAPLFTSSVNYFGKVMSASAATRACRSTKRPFPANALQLKVLSKADNSATLMFTADGILKGQVVLSWCTVTLKKVGQYWLVSALDEKLASKNQ